MTIKFYNNFVFSLLSAIFFFSLIASKEVVIGSMPERYAFPALCEEHFDNNIATL